MFNWLQHLFTVRALQIENATLVAQVAKLEKSVSECQATIATKDEEIFRLKSQLDSAKKHRPKVADGSNYNIFE